ncbi:MAG: hypothetical protein MUE85_25125, partial [Microscillaceae bacterium]|nr:hypothetical protein [Microscillaceae bacterium]
ATAVGTTNDGTLVRGYDEECWAYHIGTGNWALEQGSVGIEICNWGALETREGQHYTWVNDYGKRGRGVILEHNLVIELNYKNYQYYERYTDAEINTVKYWTLLNAMRFGIPLKYSEKDMWQVSNNALSGKPGLYTHNSFISWKTDISPQPKMIAMLKDLKEYEK